MIALKVEKIGDQVGVVLRGGALEGGGAGGGGARGPGGGDGGVLCATTQETWVEDHHARGRAFLKRYTKSLQRLEPADEA